MRSSKTKPMLFLAGIVGLLMPTVMVAQQINVATPFTNVSDSFYERNGINFGFGFAGGTGPGSRIVGYNGFNTTPNINFNQGSFGSTIPQVGGYDPNASARFGFGRRGSNGSGFSLGFELGKGNNRSITSVTPNVTVQNGFGGSIGSFQNRPFVTGVTPVIGDDIYAPSEIPQVQGYDNGVTRALRSGQLRMVGSQTREEPVRSGRVQYSDKNSSAQHGDLSVAELKARRAARLAEEKEQVLALVKKGKELESKEKYDEARRAYRDALEITTDEKTNKALKNRIQLLRGKNK